MKIKLVAFGIARDILNGSQKEIDLPAAASIADLKQHLVAEHQAFGELTSLRFAVNEDYQADDYILSEKDEVVIIPLVSGG